METTTSIPVRVGDCLCPGTPHADGDFVYLRPHLTLRGGMMAQRKIIDLASNNGQNPDTDEIIAKLAEVFCRFGVMDWSFIDEQGQPVPVNEETITARLLDDFAYGFPVADRAADLYTSGVLDPLLGRVSTSSASTPTRDSTSASNGSSGKRRKQSKPSLTSTTPMDATATITS